MEIFNMKKYSATDAKQHFGQLLDDAIKDPVAIEKQGREVAVLISQEEYNRLEQLEDLYWSIASTQLSQEGYLSVEESEAFLKSQDNNLNISIRLSKRSVKFIEKLPSKQARQIKTKILSLKVNPFPQDTKKLINDSRNRHRVDCGEYRIIYSLEEKIVSIDLVGKRNDNEVYKIMSRIQAND